MGILNSIKRWLEDQRVHRTVQQLSAIVILLSFGLVVSWGSPYDQADKTATELKWIQNAQKSLCPATEEYIKTLTFLRTTKEFQFHEDVARQIADDVSKGCTGAAERYAQILVFFKTIGFSEKKSLEMGLEFARALPDEQKNFLEIFTKSFLSEFFDYEVNKALRLAFELSKNYHGDPSVLREDFLDLVRFCKDKNSLNLPVTFCSEYAVRVAKLSVYFEEGVAKEFRSLYQQLRDKEEFHLDIKLALETTYSILKNGPRASENFFKAFQFASEDFKIDKKSSLEFALIMASHSFVGETPPRMQFTAEEKAEGNLIKY